MAMNNPYTKVKENSIYTATPQELTLMLYDGALKFVNQAIIAVEKKDYVKFTEMVYKVRNIIIELKLTLDMSYELSGTLNSLYDYILRTLSTANINKDIDQLNEVLGIIRELRDTWRQAMKIAGIQG